MSALMCGCDAKVRWTCAAHQHEERCQCGGPLEALEDNISEYTVFHKRCRWCYLLRDRVKVKVEWAAHEQPQTIEG